MSAMKNFKQAFKEMTTMAEGATPSADSEAVPMVSRIASEAAGEAGAGQESADRRAASAVSDGSGCRGTSNSASGAVARGMGAVVERGMGGAVATSRTVASGNASAAGVMPASSKSGENARITTGMVITGAIDSKTSLMIQGDVTGNISCTESVYLTGNVRGSITATFIHIDGGSVKGDLQAQTRVIIGCDSMLIGKIDAAEVEIAGKVKGNVHAALEILLAPSAFVHGDISAGRLRMESGAALIGHVDILSADAGIDPFDGETGSMQ